MRASNMYANVSHAWFLKYGLSPGGGGFSDAFWPELADIDLCLRLGAHSFSLALAAGATATLLSERAARPFLVPQAAAQDAKDEFGKLWDEALLAQLGAGYLIPDATLVYSMECGSVATLGFTNEALGFVPPVSVQDL